MIATFRTPAAFRAWLATHHKTARELVVRCYKRHAAASGLTYAQALDEALCVGWIDGIRRAVDADSFSTRFTPRQPRSGWSRINIGHAERLIADGRMKKAGLEAFARRPPAAVGAYSFENRPSLSPDLERTFRANPPAWVYYQGQAPWYQRTTAHWVMSATRDETRAKRLAILMACSARREPIPQLDRRPSEATRAAAAPPARRPSSPARSRQRKTR